MTTTERLNIDWEAGPCDACYKGCKGCSVIKPATGLEATVLKLATNEMRS